MPIRKAHDAKPGDVYTDGSGNVFAVKDVEITAQSINFLLATGRTDEPRWYAFGADDDVSLWRTGDVRADKAPQSVVEALAAHREALQAEHAAERLRQAERRAIINMATDDAYSQEWQEYYHRQVDEIDKKYHQ